MSYSNYNAYLANRAICCCPGAKGETGATGATGATGPTGPAGPVSQTPNLQQVLDAGSTGTSGQTITLDSSGNTITYGGNTITSNTSINLTADITATGEINVNAWNGIVINGKQNISTTTLNGYSIIADESDVPPVSNSMVLSPSSLEVSSQNSSLNSNTYVNMSPGGIQLYTTPDGTNSSTVDFGTTIFNYSKNGTNPAFYQFDYGNSEVFRYNNTGISMTSSGTNLNSRGIKYPCSYNATSATLDANDNAVQTFNGSGLTATLVLVTASNVGIQFVITNTSGGNMSVTTSGGAQLIYSSSGAASAATRTLATGHSQIFTAIQTTGATTYGWSMV